MNSGCRVENKVGAKTRSREIVLQAAVTVPRGGPVLNLVLAVGMEKRCGRH